ncbi:hypothetical protein V1519DRAFT_450676 [Lipomyces tetrasporus]
MNPHRFRQAPIALNASTAKMVNLRDVSISNSNLKTNTPGMVALFVEGKEQKLDLVFLSAGYLSVAGRQETSEGVDTFCSLAYYGRLRIIDNLLPLLCASLNPRVHFHAGKELAVNLDDLELRNRYSFINAVNSATTQTTLAFEELAKVYPMVSFCHVHPGFVTTGILARLTGTATGIWRLPAILARWTLVPVLHLFGRSIDEAGEWGVLLQRVQSIHRRSRKTRMKWVLHCQTGSMLRRALL